LRAGAGGWRRTGQGHHPAQPSRPPHNHAGHRDLRDPGRCRSQGDHYVDPADVRPSAGPCPWVGTAGLPAVRPPPRRRVAGSGDGAAGGGRQRRLPPSVGREPRHHDRRSRPGRGAAGCWAAGGFPVTGPPRVRPPTCGLPIRHCVTAATRCSTSALRGLVREVVHALDATGVQVVEVSHGDGLGGSSLTYGISRVDEIRLVAAAVDEATGLGSRSSYYRASARPRTCGRRTTPARPSRGSPPTARRRTCPCCTVAAARNVGYETAGFLMFSHRLAPQAQAQQARVMVDAGANCAYVVDSAGALVMGEAQQRVAALGGEIGGYAQVGFHGHQKLWLGVANSVPAHQGGAAQVDSAPRARRGRGQHPDRGARRDLRAPNRHPPGRDLRSRRGGRPADDHTTAVDGPFGDRAGCRGRLLEHLLHAEHAS